jgi:hypothetical protein
MTQRNEIPNVCPILKRDPALVDCITCCYLKELRFGDVHFYCYADRVEKGLPDYR